MDKANWEHWDRNRTKSHNPSPTNTSQPQIQASKQNKCYQKSYWKGYPTIRVNAIAFAKKDKDKDKTKNLSYIKCYTCKQKDHHTQKVQNTSGSFGNFHVNDK